MRPTRPSSGRHDLFRERLDAMINMSHPLVKLSKGHRKVNGEGGMAEEFVPGICSQASDGCP